ncbi:MAG TPA: DUF4390 domain-containing protein [Vicinamibacterales bacterium]
MGYAVSQRDKAAGRPSLPGVLRIGLACAVLLAPVVASAQDGLRVVPLVRQEHVLVSFNLTDGFTDEVRAAIQSGLKTTFTYAVELKLDVPGWVDRTIGTATATSSVEFDNLTRRYDLVRMVDGRTVDSLQTEEESAVRQWMTALRQLQLFRTSMLEPNREYYVTVRATARPSNGSILWPFGSSASAQAKFTFIR